jgi:hypothetical protein
VNANKANPDALGKTHIGLKITKSASSGLPGVKVLIIAIFYGQSRTITKAS